MKTYKSYLFRSKDPVIDELRTLIQDQNGGKLTRKSLTKIERGGGPSVGCMSEWFFGKTRRPNSATIEAAGRSIGYRRKWVRHND